MKDDELARRRAREDLCRFLAACYYQPGPEFAEEKLFDSMHGAAARLQPGFAERAHALGEAFVAVGLEELLLDYTRLFLGPNQMLAKPYGSVWLGTEKALMQDSTLAMLALYEEAGFELAEDFRELPDHIAAELEFLYLLIHRENRAQRDGDARGLRAAGALRGRFLEEHLGRWVGPFTAAVAAGARTAFYRELAEFTVRFVGSEVSAG